MKQIDQDISSMSDEQLQAFILAHIAVMERSDKELYAQQLEAGYWVTRIPPAQEKEEEKEEPKRPPEVDALTWYSAQKKELDAAAAYRRYRALGFAADPVAHA